jgi:hypothetical protein
VFDNKGPSKRHPGPRIALAPPRLHRSRRRFWVSRRRAATRPVVPQHWAWRTQEKTQDEGCGAARPLGQCRGERALQCTAIRSESSLNASSVGSQVEGRIVSAIGPGLLVLVGVHEADTDSDADYMYNTLLLSFASHFLQLLVYTASHRLNYCLFTYDYIFIAHKNLQWGCVHRISVSSVLC